MKNRIFIHISFWLAYLLFKTLLNYTTDPENENALFNLSKFWESLVPQSIYLLVKIPLVYALFEIINHYFSKKWNILRSLVVAIFVFLAAIVAYIFINHHFILNGYMQLNIPFRKELILGSVIYTSFILFFTCGIAVTIKLIRMNLQQKQATQELMKMKLETELNLLKSQMNPHFLFNTLNNIYGLAIKKSDQTAPIVMKLSQLLRFMLYDADKDFITLEEEINLLENYIELEKIRYSDRLMLDFQTDIKNPNARISPMLLLPLIENAFKHGASESTRNIIIRMKITEYNNRLSVVIENSKETQLDPSASGQIGLKNVKRQLELTYADFKLDIIELSDYFKVNLTIQLNSHGKI